MKKLFLLRSGGFNTPLFAALTRISTRYPVGLLRGSLLAGLGISLLLGGCANPKFYYWGDYEQQIYDMYIAPDKATAEIQVEKMEADIERARSAGKPLPPGYQAHLGFLYYQLGKFDLARRAFESEKAAFPESAVLMDRFIKKMRE